MNIWRREGTAPITPRSLLGEEFFEDEAPQFKSKEEWERNKAEIFRMARFHEKMLRLIESGKKPTSTVLNLTGKK